MKLLNYVNTKEIFTNYLTNAGYNISTIKSSFRNILNELVTKDPDYIWEISPDGVINILPKSTNPNNKYEKSVLNFMLPGVNIDTIFKDSIPQTVREVYLKHGMGIAELSFGDLSEYYNTPVKFKLEHPTMRQFLNELIKSAGPNFGWNLMGLKGQRFITFSWYKPMKIRQQKK